MTEKISQITNFSHNNLDLKVCLKRFAFSHNSSLPSSEEYPEKLD